MFAVNPRLRGYVLMPAEKLQRALQLFPSPRRQALLQQLVWDGAPPVRAAAARVLGFQQVDLGRALSALLASNDREELCAALYCLRYRPRPEGDLAIRQALAAADGEVATAGLLAATVAGVRGVLDTCRLMVREQHPALATAALLLSAVPASRAQTIDEQGLLAYYPLEFNARDSGTGHYDGTIFHRVMDGFMIQGGGFAPGMLQKPTHDAIQNEANNGLKNKAYTVAMARTNAPHSATSQFFVNLKDNDFLDYRPGNHGYAVFGRVTAGMDTIDKIAPVDVARATAAIAVMSYVIADLPQRLALGAE